MKRTIAAAVLIAAMAFAAEPPTPKVLSLPPMKPDWFNLTVNEKKIGYMFGDQRDGTFEGKPARVTIAEFSMSLLAPTEKDVSMRMEKFYELKEGGRLVGFKIDRAEDGVSRTYLGRCSPTGTVVIHKRPKLPDERLELPATHETIETTELARLAILTKRRMSGMAFGDDLVETDIGYEYKGDEVLHVGGRAVPVSWVRDDAGRMSAMTADGRTVEIRMNAAMRGTAATEAEAKAPPERLDVVAMARIEAPRPEATGELSGTLEVAITGLPPDAELTVAGRQRAERLPDGRVVVRIAARPPLKPVKLDPQWRKREDLLSSLATTSVFDAKHPGVVAFAKTAVGGERDAWAAAKKLSTGVQLQLNAKAGVAAASASEQLARREGSSEGYGRLYVAGARSLGLPARIVEGLVYREDSFSFHTWPEVFVGEWIPIDPFLGQDVADATHIALTVSPSKVLGRLKVEVVK